MKGIQTFRRQREASLTCGCLAGRDLNRLSLEAGILPVALLLLAALPAGLLLRLLGRSLWPVLLVVVLLAGLLRIEAWEV